jgi:DNA-binding transcriptional MerR regulator
MISFMGLKMPDLSRTRHHRGLDPVPESTPYATPELEIGEVFMEVLTTGRLAAKTGVSIETLRFYHRIGLLPEPPRTASGYRQYPAEAVRRVRFIRRAKGLGFKLSEIGDLLALGTDSPDDRVRMEKKVLHAMERIEEQAKELEAMMASLSRLAEACRSNGGGDIRSLLEAE